ncbi:MAG: FAD-dependent monooxygenase [Deltaproteobacteria bacterium]|nr:FAD-dependent monooxygenase [Deltaproteobacteria bacterium]
MAKRYDLVVVGAGPAGLMAAKVAGENGIKTALIERRKDISITRRTDGGALGLKSYLFKQMLTYNPRDKRFCFPTSGFSLSYDGPIKSLYGFRVCSPGGNYITFGDWKELRKDPEKNRVGVALDKGLLLKGILDEIEKKQDVDVYLGKNFTHIEKSGEKWKITADENEFVAKYVIAADGINSRITRILGMNKQRKFLGTSKYLTLTLENVEPPEEIDGFLFILTDYGVFDILPICYEGRFHVDHFTRNPEVNLLEELNKFMNEDKVYSTWFKKARKTGEVQSCVVNLNSPIKDPYHDGVLIIGDAAWIQEMGNMGAFCCGWKAANALSLALVGDKFEEEAMAGYLKWWNDIFYGQFGDVEFPELSFSKYLSADDIDYLVGLVTKPFPATLDFFELFSGIGDAYVELLPRIQEERPDVYGKLLQMRDAMEEDNKRSAKAGFPNR